MNDDDERKGLLSNETTRLYPNASAPSPHDQVPSYQESIEQTSGYYAGGGGGGRHFAPVHMMPAGQPSPPQQPIIFQPNYQTMPFIQTQVILVGGCPTCR
jgi:hypothetical protein